MRSTWHRVVVPTSFRIRRFWRRLTAGVPFIPTVRTRWRSPSGSLPQRSPIILGNLPSCIRDAVRFEFCDKVPQYFSIREEGRLQKIHYRYLPWFLFAGFFSPLGSYQSGVLIFPWIISISEKLLSLLDTQARAHAYKHAFFLCWPTSTLSPNPNLQFE